MSSLPEEHILESPIAEQQVLGIDVLDVYSLDWDIDMIGIRIRTGKVGKLKTVMPANGDCINRHELTNRQSFAFKFMKYGA